VKKKISVSVIIPCYNSKDTILTAIKSILSQTLYPLEVLIIDDKSKNFNEEKKYLVKAKKLLNQKNINTDLIYNKSNQGPAQTRNVGWELAKGKYIAFLDSDDAWYAKKLEVQYSIMERNSHYDLSCHDSSYLNRNKFLKECPLIDNNNSGRLINYFELFFKNKIQTRTVMIKTNIKERFNSNIRYSEDLDLWLRLKSSKKTIFFIDKNLAIYFKKNVSFEGLSSHVFKFWKSELKVLARNIFNFKLLYLILPFILLFSSFKFVIRLSKLTYLKIKE